MTEQSKRRFIRFSKGEIIIRKPTLNYIGEIRNNNKGTPMKIIAARNKSDIDIQFLDEFGYVKQHSTYQSFGKGEIKNPYDKTIYGRGYLGGGKFTATRGDRKDYMTWIDMIDRCYVNQEEFPSYYHISTVCEEWFNFQKFALWYEENRYECPGRLHLDKDILIPGNKIYSPDTCLLVPQRINMLFVNLPNPYRLPNGIRKTDTNRFYATYGGKHLGTYDTLEEAYCIYAKEKEKFIKQIADEYQNIIPAKLYRALYEYKVDINNDKNYRMTA